MIFMSVDWRCQFGCSAHLFFCFCEEDALKSATVVFTICTQVFVDFIGLQTVQLIVWPFQSFITQLFVVFVSLLRLFQLIFITFVVKAYEMFQTWEKNSLLSLYHPLKNSFKIPLAHSDIQRQAHFLKLNKWQSTLLIQVMLLKILINSLAWTNFVVDLLYPISQNQVFKFSLGVLAVISFLEILDNHLLKTWFSY